MPNHRLDLKDQEFGNITVKRFDYVDDRGHSCWVCVCKCLPWREFTVQGYQLKRGSIQSCGCINRAGNKGNLIHGLIHHYLYSIRKCIIQRCYNTNNDNYKWYGGRGIKLCDKWLNSVEDFVHDILSEIGERPDSMSLDRINNDGNYEPGNLRWATAKEQSNNMGDINNG
jgi:hypothetical protein